MGDTYTPTEIDVSSASGTCGGGTPRVPGAGAGSNRHCAAWEEVSAAFNLIADCWEKHGFTDCDPDALRALANACKMLRNRGE